METLNSNEVVDSCREATTISQQSKSTLPTIGFEGSTTPIINNHLAVENVQTTSTLPPLSSSRKKRKLTSSIWDHFEKVIQNENDWVICRH